MASFRWVAYPFVIISALISIIILKRDYTKRKGWKIKTKLDLFSICTLIICVIANIMASLKYASICKLLTLVYFGAYNFQIIRIFITLYQISRLEYCFSVNQVHSKKYGYPKWIFMLLYAQGIILLIAATISVTLNLFAPIQVLQIGLGFCYPTNDYIEDASNSIVVITAFAWFILWDWSVVILYVIKICQFYGKKAHHIEDIVTLRINFILYKILFLTIIIEIHGAISFWLFTIGTGNDINEVYVGLFLSWFLFEWTISAMTFYLMLSHNDDEYIKLIKFMDRLKMFCCCRGLIRNVLLYHEHIILENRDLERKGTVDTKTANQLPEQMQMEISKMSEEI